MIVTVTSPGRPPLCRKKWLLVNLIGKPQKKFLYTAYIAFWENIRLEKLSHLASLLGAKKAGLNQLKSKLRKTWKKNKKKKNNKKKLLRFQF